jgi:molybdopterin/thiamine biosynthesis adenylyltransferase
MGESHGQATASPSHQVNYSLATTCVTAGILSSTASAIAGLQCSEALKLLTGQGRPNDGLLHSDVGENNFEVFPIKRQQDYTAPGNRRYQFLED